MKKNNKRLSVIISAVIAILCTSCGETADSYKNEAASKGTTTISGNANTEASDPQNMDTERSDSSLEEPVSSNHVLEGIWHGVWRIFFRLSLSLCSGFRCSVSEFGAMRLQSPSHRRRSYSLTLLRDALYYHHS